MRRAIEHIVLVDDEDDHHFITRMTLKKAGFQGRFDAFHSADEALRHLRAGEIHPDLILVDINMPGTTGFDLLRLLEAEGVLPDDRSMVVMCSSSNRPMDIETARRFRSVDDYVEKSFNLEQFERLSDAFARKRAKLRGISPAMKKVLIIEDEAIISFGYRLQLEQMGLEVMGTARSSDEAEALLAEQRPDVIIMDVYIKGELNGLQLAQRIHEKDPIPVIFLTASNKPEIVEGIRAMKGCHYLLKPIDTDSLSGLLHATVRADA